MSRTKVSVKFQENSISLIKLDVSIPVFPSHKSSKDQPIFDPVCLYYIPGVCGSGFPERKRVACYARPLTGTRNGKELNRNYILQTQA